MKFVDRAYLAYLFLNGRAFMPLEANIEITYLCNCRCQMCPLYHNKEIAQKQEERKNEELPCSEWKKIIQNLRLAGLEHLHFLGGEPFLKEGFIDILSFAKKLGMRISITTNGSLIRGETAQHLIALSIDRIGISLDGPREIHNRIRQNDVFDSVLQGIDFINLEKKKQKSKTPEITLCCTISKLNQSSLAELVKIAAEKKVPINYNRCSYTTEEMLLKAHRLCPTEGVKNENQNLPAAVKNIDVEILYEELKKIKKNAKSLGVNYSIDMATKKDIINSFDDKFSFCNKCFLPWHRMQINPFGIVYPCSLNINMGNLTKESLPSIWNGLKYVDLRQRLKKIGLYPSCKKCCVLEKRALLWNILPKIF